MSNITYPTSNNNQPLIQNLDCYQTYFEIDHPRDGFGKTLVKIVLWIFCFWFLIPWKALRAGTTEQLQTAITASVSPPTTPTQTAATTTHVIPPPPADLPASTPSMFPTHTRQIISGSVIGIEENQNAILITTRISPRDVNYLISHSGRTYGEMRLVIRSDRVEIVNFSVPNALQSAREALIDQAIGESNSHGFEGRVTTTSGDVQLAEILRRQSTTQRQPPAPTSPSPSATATTTTTQTSAVVTPAPTQPAPPATTSSTPAPATQPAAPTTQMFPTSASRIISSAVLGQEARANASLHTLRISPTDVNYRIYAGGRLYGDMRLVIRSDRVEIVNFIAPNALQSVKEALIDEAIGESNSHGFEGRVTTTSGDVQLAEILRRQSTAQRQPPAHTSPSPPATATTTTTQTSAVVTPAPTQPAPPATTSSTSAPATQPAAPTTQTSAAPSTTTTQTPRTVTLRDRSRNCDITATISLVPREGAEYQGQLKYALFNESREEIACILLNRHASGIEIIDCRYTLATAGNLLGTITGVEAPLIQAAVQESLSQGFGGRITVTADRWMQPIYFQMGFVPMFDTWHKYDNVRTITEVLERLQFRTIDLSTFLTRTIPTLSAREKSLIYEAKRIVLLENDLPNHLPTSLSDGDLELIQARWYWDGNYPVDVERFSRPIRAAIAAAGPNCTHVTMPPGTLPVEMHLSAPAAAIVLARR